MRDNIYDPDVHHRRSIRLKGYDYLQAGAYFATICVQNRECLFGDIVDGEMMVNEAGEMVMKVWHDLPNHYGNVTLDEFVIMPNHVHGIIVLFSGDVGAIHELPLHELPLRDGTAFDNREYRRQMLLPKIVGRFKMNTAKRINETRNTPGIPVWQRNYYEHIIRNDDELNGIREYIVNNPVKWAEDEENPGNVKGGRPYGNSEINIGVH